jgi:hypothetical protein
MWSLQFSKNANSWKFSGTKPLPDVKVTSYHLFEEGHTRLFFFVTYSSMPTFNYFVENKDSTCHWFHLVSESTGIMALVNFD